MMHLFHDITKPVSSDIVQFTVIIASIVNRVIHNEILLRVLCKFQFSVEREIKYARY